MYLAVILIINEDQIIIETILHNLLKEPNSTDHRSI